MNKEYIGDGVYVQEQDFQLILTTPDHVIYLDQEVFVALCMYVKKVFPGLIGNVLVN